MSEIVNLVLWLLIVLVFLGLVCLYLYRRDFLKEDDSHQFSSLLNELQRDQGYEPIELVSAWNEEEKVNISNRFRIAWEAGEFAESEIILSADTNQSSRGIQLWNRFRPLLAEQLDGYI